MVDSADVMDNEERNKREYANKAYSLLFIQAAERTAVPVPHQGNIRELVPVLGTERPRSFFL
jgi:hypothetical protein